MKTRKNLLTFCSIILLSFSSCVKEENSSEKNTNQQKISIPSIGISLHNLDVNKLDLTDKQKHIVNEVINGSKKREVGLICASAFGKYLSNNKSFKISGHFMDDIKLDIGNCSVQGSDFPNNMVSYRNPEIEQLYGTEQTYSVSVKGNQSEFTTYIPKPIQIHPLSFNPSSGKLKLSENSILKWTPDLNNDFPYVFFRYITRNDEKNPNSGDKISQNVLLLEDDGEFDLKQIINSQEQKSIDFSISRGNAELFEDVLFQFKSIDHHWILLEQ